ncbi:MAG: DNA polymerase IV [Pontibacterium sp.]
MQRKIIHLDCDCFFAAVEIRDNPEWGAVPLAVGGSSQRRGVIATCNYVAREYGIHSAMPTAKALQLCPQLTVIPGHMEKYRQASAQIMSIYRDYTEVIEPLSLDEAYLDVTESMFCRGSATLMAEEIRARVKAEVGITVSAGVAPCKFLAKIASDWNKPDGLFLIRPSEVQAFVETLAVKKLFGVGEKTAARLHQHGLMTCGDLKKVPLPQLVKAFGRFGQCLYELCRGIDERPVRVSRVRKSISVENTFSSDLPDLESCLHQLPGLLDNLETRFEKYHGKYSIKGAVVKLKFLDFTQTTAEHATEQLSPVFFERLLCEAYERGAKPVRLMGVGYRLGPVKLQQGEQLRLI